jgi:hypothetical protein
MRSIEMLEEKKYLLSVERYRYRVRSNVQYGHYYLLRESVLKVLRRSLIQLNGSARSGKLEFLEAMYKSQ